MISSDEFSKLCRLAKLKIGDDRVDSFREKLNEIFGWIDQLQGIEVKKTNEPDTSCIGTIHSREDIQHNNTSYEDVLSNTDFKKFNMFKVPKVVE